MTDTESIEEVSSRRESVHCRPPFDWSTPDDPEHYPFQRCRRTMECASNVRRSGDVFGSSKKSPIASNFV